MEDSKKQQSTPNPDDKEKQRNFMKPVFNDPLAKREHFAVSLRKKKTQQAISEKRRKLQQNQEATSSDANQDAKIQVLLKDYDKKQYQGYPNWLIRGNTEQKQILEQFVGDNLNDYQAYSSASRIQFLVQKMTNSNSGLSQIEQLAIVTQMRKEICNDPSPPYLSILQETQLLDLCGQILQLKISEQMPLIRFMILEVSWIISNFTYCNEDVIKFLYNPQYGLVNFLNQALKSEDSQMIDQVIWIISNTACESLELRNMILSQTHVINGLTQFIQKTQQQDGMLREAFLNNIIWCLLCITKHQKVQDNNPNILIQLGIEEKQKVLFILNIYIDLDVQTNLNELINVIYYLTEDDDKVIEQICKKPNFLKAIMKQLKAPNDEENHPAIRLVSTLSVTNNPEIIDLLLYNGALDALNCLLHENQKQQQIKEILFALSNINAGTDQQISQFLQCDQLVQKVFHLMNSALRAQRKEAYMVMTNLILSTQQVNFHKHIVFYDQCLILTKFVEGLNLDDVQLILEILQSIFVLLSLDEQLGLQGEDQVAFKLEIAKGLDQLEQLQQHPNINVYKECERIISAYFKNEDDQEYMDE